MTTRRQPWCPRSTARRPPDLCFRRRVCGAVGRWICGHLGKPTTWWRLLPGTLAEGFKVQMGSHGKSTTMEDTPKRPYFRSVFWVKYGEIIWHMYTHVFFLAGEQHVFLCFSMVKCQFFEVPSSRRVSSSWRPRPPPLRRGPRRATWWPGDIRTTVATVRPKRVENVGRVYVESNSERNNALSISIYILYIVCWIHKHQTSYYYQSILFSMFNS